MKAAKLKKISSQNKKLIITSEFKFVLESLAKSFKTRKKYGEKFEEKVWALWLLELSQDLSC